MSGLITNPDVVQRAVNDKNKSQKKPIRKEKLKENNDIQVNGRKGSGKQEIGKVNGKSRDETRRNSGKAKEEETRRKLKDEETRKKPSSEETRKKSKDEKRSNGKSKPVPNTQINQSIGPNHVRAKSSPVDSTEELRRALFPDLYGDISKPEAKNSTPKKPRSQQSTPNKNGQYKSTSSPNSQFAGSSFHSSPAPSSLPKPAFKMKTVDQQPMNGEPVMNGEPSINREPFFMAGAPIPPPHFPHMPMMYNPMLPTSAQGGPSMFDQFMIADRQERASQQPK